MIRSTRSQPPPASLDSSKKYDGQDVKDRLDDDFHGKCYLCERFHDQQFTVEHLKPQSAFPDLVCEWNNLFPAHHECNNGRKSWATHERIVIDGESKAWPIDGMLDPCEDDVEARLVQRLEPTPTGSRVQFAPVDPNDLPAKNTAAELDHLHNGRKSHNNLIRSNLTARYAYMIKLVRDLMLESNTEERRILDQLDALVSHEAEFSGVLRYTLRETLEGTGWLQHLDNLPP